MLKKSKKFGYYQTKKKEEEEKKRREKLIKAETKLIIIVFIQILTKIKLKISRGLILKMIEPQFLFLLD